MQRIYLPKTDFLDTLKISDVEIHHQLTRVLRSRVWDEIIFFGGKKQKDHVYTISAIDKKSIEFEKKEVIKKDTELPLNLHLYQAFPNKLSKLEYIIQKCSEIGYSSITFFSSEHSEKRGVSEAKEDRLRRISIEAIEQCGGNIIPEIIFWDDITDLKSGKKILSIVCDPTSEAKEISKISMKSYSDVHVFVGPEGWFSEDELLACNKRGFHRVSLGERILRCETVGEVVGFFISQKK